jgi:hypothetical protein
MLFLMYSNEYNVFRLYKSQLMHRLYAEVNRKKRMNKGDLLPLLSSLISHVVSWYTNSKREKATKERFFYNIFLVSSAADFQQQYRIKKEGKTSITFIFILFFSRSTTDEENISHFYFYLFILFNNRLFIPMSTRMYL